MTLKNEVQLELFPLITKQSNFYKELSIRNLKWCLGQFKNERIEEDVYLLLAEYNHRMEELSSEVLREILEDA